MSLAHTHLQIVLAAMAGPAARPREDQLAAVAALVEQRDRVLVVQATGWGKSAVYWAATSALRASGGGPTLIVSPLLALMRDQVDAAARAGLRAATINSTNLDDWDAVFADIAADRLDVLLVSPERLGNPGFAQRLPALLAGAALVVIDEAHCISDWGFDFRPDYQRLSRTLLGIAAGTPVLATTATANQRVTEDIARQLGSDTQTFRGSLARSSLRLAVVPGLAALERLAWVADALDCFAGSGIVYALTVADTERIAGFLRSCGFEVAAYHGGLDAPARQQIEDALRRNALKAVVATSALGMGYDKPDLAFCIHVGSPASPVAYYQQVGRAGRALDDALAVLLPAETDERIWAYFATAGVPDEKRVGQILAALADGPLGLVALENATGIRRGRLEGLLKILAVEEVVQREGPAWALTGQPWTFDAARWQALGQVRAREAGLMRAFAAGQGCLMRFLQEALDDPAPSDCGRCSVCTSRLPAPGAQPAAPRVEAARLYARGQDVVIAPRKLWPAGGTRKGRITACGEGRALAFADDPGWADALLPLLAAPDALAPQPVLDGVVAVLGRWRRSWGARPVAVVPLPSATHPQLLHAVAAHVAQAGRLPLVDALQLRGPSPDPDLASAAKVAALNHALALRSGVEVPAGPLLLVGLRYRSGWAMTVAAALLREAGAADVLPLVLHQAP
ncbi:RecQ family ATP-dependent DNA helicase [Xenophilus arseniciresistens]|uniref:DNA 3'-5' helicase n=1 Tax=Xenophilus arseniciresistens TaxID=1283306 RepID=A0AAE3NBD6_9BURK|nr:RecQ family ATP-dependent DNA helicase [Xenophilus arseniciresistens]MDA7418044.1 RecQ family ATP-dependent DNA helicase [Xenophilus arseniciresistens]